MYSVTVYSKPALGFPGGYADHFYGNKGDALRWLAAGPYNGPRYEIVWA